MKPNLPLSGADARGSDRRRGTRRARLRYAALFVAAGTLGGCAGDVALQNPRTGKTELCGESPLGVDPWSQTQACVASHEAQGWTRTSEE